MRKWMRDRLKRPKKNTEAGKSEPAQAPLQPAYYDAPEALAEGEPAAAAAIETAGAAKATPAAAPRASKGTVVLAIGLPGSGKSSWFKRHNITPLSSDMLRALLFDDPTEQRFQDL